MGNNVKFCVFGSLRGTESKLVGVDEIIRLIKYDDSVAKKTELYRQMARSVSRDTAKKEVKEKSMPAFSVGVVFKPAGRQLPDVEYATGFALCDIDKNYGQGQIVVPALKKVNLQVNEGDYVAIMGPSGSGKSKIAKKLLDAKPQLEKLITYTTADPTAVYENDWYNYVSRNEFYQMLDDKIFFESTMYAGHGYGSKKDDVDAILAKGKSVLATMDICGAMALKSRYDNVITIYIKKDRKELISSILDKKCSKEDKVNRLISIDDEKRNEEICDYVVEVTNRDYDSSVKEIIDILGLND